MRLGKLTVKIPLQYVEYLKEQAEISGEGVQSLAGKVFMHGLIDLRERSAKREEELKSRQETADSISKED